MTDKIAISLGRTKIKTLYCDAEACVYLRAEDVIAFLKNGAQKSNQLAQSLPPFQRDQATAVAETLATYCETFNLIKKDVIQRRAGGN